MKKYNDFVKINELMAIASPVELKSIDKENRDKEILRLGIVAELDAVSLYEQLADSASNEKIKKTLLNIAKEEKTHIGELQALLKELDPEYKEELKKGKEEVEKNVGAASDEKEEKEEKEDKDEKEEK